MPGSIPSLSRFPAGYFPSRLSGLRLLKFLPVFLSRCHPFLQTPRNGSIVVLRTVLFHIKCPQAPVFSQTRLGCAPDQRVASLIHFPHIDSPVFLATGHPLGFGFPVTATIDWRGASGAVQYSPTPRFEILFCLTQRINPSVFHPVHQHLSDSLQEASNQINYRSSNDD